MAAVDYLIQNCRFTDVEAACPKQWSGLKPSLMAAVRNDHHRKRKVYLCTTDADLKLYTLLKYCIVVIKPQTEAETEEEVRTESIVCPRAGIGRQMVGEALAGVLKCDAYEVPIRLRMPLPDKDEAK